MVAREDASIEPNKDAVRDLSNCVVGIAWQLTLVTIPLYLVFRDVRGTLISLAVLVGTSIFLKKFWYDRLERDEIKSSPEGELKVASEVASG
jgi:solute:Na+ symporter, SSS family